MRKNIYILAVAIIIAVLMSGCLSKDQAKEIVAKVKPATSQPTVAPGSDVQGGRIRAACGFDAGYYGRA